MIKKKLKKEIELFVYSRLTRLLPGFLSLWEYDPSRTLDGFADEKYYSQMFQDFYLDTIIFNRKENGVFLDIGGNDPIKFNNTYFFEKERCWSGLAFEPMPQMHDKWNVRTTKCYPYALGKENKKVMFCEYETDTISCLESEADSESELVTKYEVEQRTLTSVLEEEGIYHIDLASIDVEGAEMGVLEGIDFNKITIDYIVIENNKDPKRIKELRRYLMKRGYKMIARLWIDDVWKLEK